jgi:gliding motility-associated-like protein
VLRWTIGTSGSCTPSTDDVAIAFEVTPTVANAGPDQSVCSTSTVLTANTAVIGSGRWTVISGDGNEIFGDLSSPISAFTGTAGVTYVLEWTIANSCASTSDQVTIKLEASPSISNAGPDQFLCGTSFTTLAANTPTVGKGNWIVVSGTGGFPITSSDPLSQFVGVAGNSYTLRWVITNGSCTPSIDDVVINFSASPVATSPVTVCVNNPAPVLTATAPGATSFKWYLFTAPATRTLLATTPTGSFTPGAELIRTTPGTFTYEVTAVYTCGESPATQIVVNVSNTGSCGGGSSNCTLLTTIDIDVVAPSCPSPDGGMLTFNLASGSYDVILEKQDGTAIDPVGTERGDTVVFDNLTAGLYYYTIQDLNVPANTCKSRVSYILDKLTEVVIDSVYSIQNVSCYGGLGNLKIASQGTTTGKYFFSFVNNGIESSPEEFTPGAYLPNGLPANDDDFIIIKVDETSALDCPDTVMVRIKNLTAKLVANFVIDDATCNANDGSITVQSTSGGSGSGYVYSLNGGAYGSGPFENLSGGDYVLTIMDGAGCTRDTTVSVTFPGFIDYIVTPSDATCDNNGLSGSLTVSFTNTGNYQLGLSTDALIEPTTYYSNQPSIPFVFDSLSRNVYYVFVKSASSQCPTVKGTYEISGEYAIDFDILPICTDNKVSLSLINMKLNPNAGYEFRVYKKFTNILLATINRGYPNTLTDSFEYDDYEFLRLPDEYVIQISQVAGICEMKSEFKDYTVKESLFAQVGTTSESYPDILTGKMQVTKFTGGQIPYEVRIELDSASVGGQAFQTDWDEVLLNNNLQYEKNYSNIPAGRYNVQVRDSIGCVIEVVGRVPLDTDIYIPNIFTPNEDGSNDVFFIRNLPDADAKLVITDRWGKQVYSTNSYQNNWTAEGVSDGIYYYRLKMGEGSALTGWVEVLRGAKP